MTPAQRDLIEENQCAAYELGALLDVMTDYMNGTQTDPMAQNAIAGMARMAKSIGDDVGRLLTDRV